MNLYKFISEDMKDFQILLSCKVNKKKHDDLLNFQESPSKKFGVYTTKIPIANFLFSWPPLRFLKWSQEWWFETRNFYVLSQFWRKVLTFNHSSVKNMYLINILHARGMISWCQVLLSLKMKDFVHGYKKKNIQREWSHSIIISLENQCNKWLDMTWLDLCGKNFTRMTKK